MKKLDTVKMWINRDFNEVPGQVFEELAKTDEDMLSYDSDLLRLLSAPKIECAYCGQREPAEFREESCDGCDENDGDDWVTLLPEYAFPCGWGTLFSPKDPCDVRWFEQNAEEVSKLGIYVFESDLYGVLLGIDAGGFDFYEAYWVPLYELRGLKWHDQESSEAV